MDKAMERYTTKVDRIVSEIKQMKLDLAAREGHVQKG
jgi:hypothetical protein